MVHYGTYLKNSIFYYYYTFPNRPIVPNRPIRPTWDALMTVSFLLFSPIFLFSQKYEVTSDISELDINYWQMQVHEPIGNKLILNLDSKDGQKKTFKIDMDLPTYLKLDCYSMKSRIESTVPPNQQASFKMSGPGAWIFYDKNSGWAKYAGYSKNEFRYIPPVHQDGILIYKNLGTGATTYYHLESTPSGENHNIKFGYIQLSINPISQLQLNPPQTSLLPALLITDRFVLTINPTDYKIKVPEWIYDYGAPKFIKLYPYLNPTGDDKYCEHIANSNK